MSDSTRLDRSHRRWLEAQLRQVVRRGRVLTSEAHLASYDADGLGYKHYRPDAVVIPADGEELAVLVRRAGALGVPLVVRGAGTSLSGGPVAAQGGVVVHTSALRAIRQVEPQGLWCEVECGVTLQQLDSALRPHGLFYPPDPSSGVACTLGGNVATNAGGAHCFRHGVTGNYVLGVELLLPDGTLHRFGGPAGGRGDWLLDWKRLMVGSEGTLGAFTRLWLRLLPRPQRAWTFRATFSRLQQAEAAIHALVSHPAYPVAIELMDPRCVALVESSSFAVGLPGNAFMLIAELDGPVDWVDSHVDSVARLLRRSGAVQLDWSDRDEPREKLWRARKAAGGLLGQVSADLVVQDAVIPKGALAEALELVYAEADAAGIAVVNVFHAGDGNLHPNFLFDASQPGQLERVEAISKRLMHWVIQAGGTLSGEHGIGNDKMPYMPLVFGPDEMRLQLSAAKAFNPLHQMNPSKVFAARWFQSLAGGERSATANADGPLATAASPHTGGTGGRGLFTHFVDTVDAVVCLAAESSGAEARRILAGTPYRLPLVVDSAAPLREQIDASLYSPASARFGCWCDNVLGMNWRLADGPVVRLGERVVKSATGYDLLRLLLGSGDWLGVPLDFVLRLRPAEPLFACYRVTGDDLALAAAAAELRGSNWTHWFDSIDYGVDGRRGAAWSPQLRIVVNLSEARLPIVDRWFQRFAAAHGLRVAGQLDAAAPDDGLPDLVIKTTPDRAATLAALVAGQHAVRCLASVVTGAILVAGDGPEVDRGQIDRWARQLADQVVPLGGDCHSRWSVATAPGQAEQHWITSLFGVESS